MHWGSSLDAKIRETTTQHLFAAGRVSSGDPTLIQRIVGYFEYQQALTRLSAFVRHATTEELVGAEEIVRDEPEYRVYSLFAKKEAPQVEPLNSADDAKDYRPVKSVDRTLARVIALARVELAGMLAGFSQHPSPFEAVDPMAYEMEEFRHFILEGAAWQHQALAADPQLRSVGEQFPPTVVTLAYIRRLNIARHFCAAATRSAILEANAIASGQKPLDGEFQRVPGAPDNRELYPHRPDLWLAKLQQLDEVFGVYRATVNTYVNKIQVAQTAHSKVFDKVLERCVQNVCTTYAPLPELSVQDSGGLRPVAIP